MPLNNWKAEANRLRKEDRRKAIAYLHKCQLEGVNDSTVFNCLGALYWDLDRERYKRKRSPDLCESENPNRSGNSGRRLDENWKEKANRLRKINPKNAIDYFHQFDDMEIKDHEVVNCFGRLYHEMYMKELGIIRRTIYRVKSYMKKRNDEHEKRRSSGEFEVLDTVPLALGQLRREGYQRRLLRSYFLQWTSILLIFLIVVAEYIEFNTINSLVPGAISVVFVFLSVIFHRAIYSHKEYIHGFRIYTGVWPCNEPTIVFLGDCYKVTSICDYLGVLNTGAIRLHLKKSEAVREKYGWYSHFDIIGTYDREGMMLLCEALQEQRERDDPIREKVFAPVQSRPIAPAHASVSTPAQPRVAPILDLPSKIIN